jgi:glycosyltransferase involved in cell wall biosynthesis
VNASIVNDGVNGLHARDQAEWVDGVERLLRDHGMRAQLGRQARRTVEERFSAQVQAPRMAEILRRAAMTRTP